MRKRKTSKGVPKLWALVFWWMWAALPEWESLREEVWGGTPEFCFGSITSDISVNSWRNESEGKVRAGGKILGP